ncbi:MAG: SMC-Scp complex subunit ScpB [Clostridia bacterium]|nr:SMC-Scp complex subunit ScpB [Clostridia bacterium]MBQ9408068.1 SMC-Scp complex subunit ScpB [Clostridia bacterium]
MDQTQLCGVLEAILYVAGEPVNAQALAHALNLTTMELEEAVEQLKESCVLDKRGLRLNRHGGEIQLSINPDYAPYVEAFLQPVKRQSLSQAVLETLSIIAYRQPVTKSDIEAVRGVKCDYSVQLLLARGLIEEQGRRETLGRPILYGTTDKFLRHFGLEGLNQLPEEETHKTEGEAQI